MRLVHLADIHLGFGRFERLTPEGANQIETDTADVFGVAVDRIIALAPDLVVVGGDVVHTAKPRPAAVLAMVSGFAKLVRALPDTIVIIAAGNHDVPKADRSRSMLAVLESFGVHVADRASKRFYFADRDLSVLAVPDAPGLARPVLQPDARARQNVMVLHGEVQGMLPAWKLDSRETQEITADEMGLDAWSYVALGHWHCHREIAPNCFYSGSLTYTSSNVWAELATPKGFIERDLESGAQTFHEIPQPRRYLDLPPIDAHGMGAEQLDTAIRDAAESAGDLTGCVVRLIVEGVDRLVGRALDQKNLKAVRRGTLNFQLDLRRPVYVESALSMMVRGVDQPGARAKTVEERTREKLEARDLAPDVNRGDLIAMAMTYLDAAKERDLPRATEDELPLLPAAPRQAVA